MNAIHTKKSALDEAKSHYDSARSASLAHSSEDYQGHTRREFEALALYETAYNDYFNELNALQHQVNDLIQRSHDEFQQAFNPWAFWFEDDELRRSDVAEPPVSDEDDVELFKSVFLLHRQPGTLPPSRDFVFDPET